MNAPAGPSPFEAALDYAARGWAVIPIHVATDGVCTCREREQCDSPGKHPAGTIHGCKDATCDPTTITEWWQRMPWANVGIATGEISGLVVLDVDPRNGGLESLKQLEAKHGPLPATVTSVTGGGGIHLLMAY